MGVGHFIWRVATDPGRCSSPSPSLNEVELAPCSETDLTHPLSKFNIHVLFPPQGADKDFITKDGRCALGVAECEKIKALLQWDAAVWEVAGQVGERTDRWMQWSPDSRWTSPFLTQSTSVLTLLLSVSWRSFCLSGDFPLPCLYFLFQVLG